MLSIAMAALIKSMGVEDKHVGLVYDTFMERHGASSIKSIQDLVDTMRELINSLALQ